MIGDLFSIYWSSNSKTALPQDMEVDVYFDESGDLGWTLDKPYRKGGSSRYFTVAYLILPTYKNKHINRFS